MEIIFYKTKDDADHIYKILTNPVEINGHLREACDVLNPVIEFEYNPAIIDCNYCIINDFKRKYFITGFIVDGQTMVVRLHVDVLSTYASDILASPATVVRSQNGNKYITDNRATQTDRVDWTNIDLGNAFYSGSSYILVKGVTS